MSGPVVRALLVDLEGTIVEAGRPVSGAAAALAALAANGVPVRFATNTTSRPRSVLARELAAFGVAAPPERIFTAPRAAREYLLERRWTPAHLLVRDAVREDFAGIEHAERSPRAVVVGDLGPETTYERLNAAFRLLLDGAEFVTLARNRYYRGAEGLLLDQGPFVAALEYATGRTATLVGKPAPEFFAAATRDLGVPPEEIAVVGDDLEADVGGAQRAGMRGILVRTGKFRADELARSSVRPDAILDSAADLPRLFGL